MENQVRRPEINRSFRLKLPRRVLKRGVARLLTADWSMTSSRTRRFGMRNTTGYFPKSRTQKVRCLPGFTKKMTNSDPPWMPIKDRKSNSEQAIRRRHRYRSCRQNRRPWWSRVTVQTICWLSTSAHSAMETFLTSARVVTGVAAVAKTTISIQTSSWFKESNLQSPKDSTMKIIRAARSSRRESRLTRHSCLTWLGACIWRTAAK